MKRLQLSLGPRERALRLALGLAAAIVGFRLLAVQHGAGLIGLEAFLFAAGVALGVTGASGHSPLRGRRLPAIGRRARPADEPEASG